MHQEILNLSTIIDDTSCLLHDSFYLEDQLTDVYFYPDKIKLLQKDKKRIIPVRFGVSFKVIRGEDDRADGLKLYYGDEKFQLRRFFWPRALEWEIILLKFLIKKDFNSYFQIIRKIGKGNFSSVYLVEDIREDKQYAVKTFLKEDLLKSDGFTSLENQIQIMRQLKHPNLIQLYGVYQSKSSIFLLLQYTSDLTLQTFLKKNKQVTIEQRRKIIKELLKGLIQLARFSIVHRDLKPQNIIVSPDCQSVKILDFGLATNINEANYLYTRCGTPGYVAPQILKIKDYEQVRLGVQSDMFSLGAIYFELIYGQPLFKGKNKQELLLLNRQVDIMLTYKEQLIGFEQLQLLQNMLLINPSDRITPQKALKHLFFLEKNEQFYQVSQPIQSEETYNLMFDF